MSKDRIVLHFDGRYVKRVVPAGAENGVMLLAVVLRHVKKREKAKAFRGIAASFAEAAGQMEALAASEEKNRDN